MQKRHFVNAVKAKTTDFCKLTKSILQKSVILWDMSIDKYTFEGV